MAPTGMLGTTSPGVKVVVGGNENGNPVGIDDGCDAQDAVPVGPLPSKGTRPNERGTEEVHHPQQANRVALCAEPLTSPAPLSRATNRC